jgi:hypothetical protein
MEGRTNMGFNRSASLGGKMSLDSGWSFDDTLEEMLYPTSKKYALKLALVNLIFYPIIVLIYIPLSYTFSFFMGFFGASPDRKCDRCHEMKSNDVRSPLKFYWFCRDCLKEYDSVEMKFLESKSKRKAK